jgi:hypothetical protein
MTAVSSKTKAHETSSQQKATPSVAFIRMRSMENVRSFIQLVDVGEGLEAPHGGGIVLGADHEDAAFLGDDEVLETADGGEVP